MVLLEFRGGLAFRYLLPRVQRMERPSISLVRDLLLRRSFFFGHRLSLAPDRPGRGNSLYRPVDQAVTQFFWPTTMIAAAAEYVTPCSVPDITASNAQLLEIQIAW